MDENKKIDNFENGYGVDNTAKEDEFVDRDSEVMEFKEALEEINEKFQEENLEEKGDQNNSENIDFENDDYESFECNEALEKDDDLTIEIEDDEDISDNMENSADDIQENNGENSQDNVADDINQEDLTTKENIENDNSTCENVESEDLTEKNVKDEEEFIPVQDNNFNVKNNNDQGSSEEYTEYRMNKMFARIHYDLCNPELSVAEIKKRIADGANYHFKSYAVLSTKVKSLKKEIKGSTKICSVVGYNSGEMSSKAKKIEIRQSKMGKAAEIAVFMPISLIKEGNKKAVVKEYLSYFKICGSKINFKVVIDCNKVNVSELNFATSCAVEANAKAVVLYNYENAPEIYALRAAKICGNKCIVEVTGKQPNGEILSDLIGKGADTFCLKNAIATAETIRHGNI